MKHKAVTQRILAWMLALALLFTGILPANTASLTVNAASTTKSSNEITTAEEFPTQIPAGETYTLTADIKLADGQQITDLAGTLDGQGHVITLSGKALAENVSGTIQNLGVAGSVDVESDDKGSITDNLTGTIQNSYSTVTINDEEMFEEVGGIVGVLDGGSILNCYYAGTSSSFMLDGIAAYNKSANSVINNSYYTSKAASAIGKQYGDNKAQVTNCASKSADELKTADTVALLNTGIVDTGYIFAVSEDGGFPVLVKGAAEISWTPLENALKQAEGYEEENYTEESWKTLSDAVAAGNALKAGEGVTQEQITAAAKAITDAIAALKNRPTTKPVALPENVISISSQADFSKMDNAKGKYFVLTQDITVNSDYEDKSFYMNYSSFAGVLDGQGHTITFENAGSLFANLSAGAVIQNLTVKGTMTGSSSNVTGPFGTTAYGASILNCKSEISGANVAGFIGKTGAYMGASASDDRDGVIANCIAVGDTGKGALCNSSSNNSGAAIVENCYWLDTLGSGSGAMSEEDMKTLDLAEKLNANKGENGTSWGQGRDGYPYFGENQDYTPGQYEWPETGENAYDVAFQAKNETEPTVLENARLEVSPDAVGMANIAGTFSLVDYTLPEGESLSWSFQQRKPERAFEIYEDGTFCVNGTGTAVLQAVQNNSDGSQEILASVAIRSSRIQMTDIKLYVDGEDVTDGKVTVQGSEYKHITVKAQYQGSEEYQDVSYASFIYAADEAGAKLLHNRTDSSSGFSFKETGSAVFTVTAKNQPEIHKTVTVTSAYVPVTSVVPAISGTKEIHSRNANSDGQETDGRVAFNPILGSAVVTPANATNADKVMITSDDPDGTIAYYTNGEKAYIPKQAGTVTFTATIEDTNPQTGETKTVSGDSTVTFVYKNNVKTVELAEENKNMTVEAGKSSAVFAPIVTGELDDQGYDVTEPALKWTYSQRGIAQVVRTGSGYWKKNGDYNVNDPDYGSYLPVAEYQITGLSEGTVTATGTPIDGKNNVKPVTITITVTKGSTADIDVKAKAEEGINSAVTYITEKHSTDGYAYGDEWLIYALLRNGVEISSDVQDAYYQSAAAEVKKWNADQKPTDIERVALTLTAMGKDITDVDGTDLVSMICNSEKLSDGSNELIYALMALDAANAAIPADAKWSRNTIIEAMLGFQNENGGFGLTGKDSTSVDMTAMALQALAPYQERTEVKEAIDRAVSCLKEEMRDDFGYGTSESTAQVLLALSCLGIDPTSVEVGFGTPNFNMITNLMKYRQNDGGFSHLSNLTKSQEMSTVQVLQALDAYKKGTNTYWLINGENQSVAVTILGDEVHDSDKDGKIHAFVKNNLQVWAAQSEYRVPKNATAMEALDAALAANKMTSEKKYGDPYIASVTRADGVKLGEFTNGSKSGWKYSVNGTEPDVGACDYTLKDGDVVMLHYTDNYAKENTEIDEQVENVIRLIAALPSLDKLTRNDQEAVKAARAAYDALTDTQKANVENADLLVKAEAQLKALQDAKKDDDKKDNNKGDNSNNNGNNNTNTNNGINGNQNPGTQTIVRLAKVTKLTVSSKKKKAFLKWKKNSKATGYEIYRATKKNGKYKKIRTIKKASAATFTDSKVKKGKTYYYKVRAYKTVKGNKANGKFSAVRKVKIKK